MYSHSHLDDPDYWRAKDVRDLAEQVSNLRVRNDILQMAEDYNCWLRGWKSEPHAANESTARIIVSQRLRSR
jgi:hypothetical protein